MTQEEKGTTIHFEVEYWSGPDHIRIRKFARRSDAESFAEKHEDKVIGVFKVKREEI